MRIPSDPSFAQKRRVEALIKRVKDQRDTKDAINQLKEIASQEHPNGCALGAAPACTCGKREAEEFIKAP